MKILNVVVGVLFNASGEVLIAKRQDYDNLWEFPGGKIEAGETPEQALSRELQEEIGVIANRFSHLIDTHYAFPDREVYLNAYIVDAFVGDVSGAEGQLIRWERIENLDNYPFPGANGQIVNALRERV